MAASKKTLSSHEMLINRHSPSIYVGENAGSVDESDAFKHVGSDGGTLQAIEQRRPELIQMSVEKRKQPRIYRRVREITKQG